MKKAITILISYILFASVIGGISIILPIVYARHLNSMQLMLIYLLGVIPVIVIVMIIGAIITKKLSKSI